MLDLGPTGFSTPLSKHSLTSSEIRSVGAGRMGETIPKASNHVSLDPDRVHDWGVPLLHTSIDYDENDIAMIKDFLNSLKKCFIRQVSQI